MIQSGRASFVGLSTITEPSDISDPLSLEPTDVILKGTTSRWGRTREQHAGAIYVDTLDNTEDDQSGTRALRVLLDRCSPAVGRGKHLPRDCEARISWSADSDPTQGGFVMSTDLARAIAALDVDVYATVYREEDGHFVPLD